MTEDTTLREKVREAIRAGRLPSTPPERTWGGRGCGAYYCTICGERINPDQVEFELEYRRTGANNGKDGNGSGNVHVHLRCFSAWDLERYETTSSRAHMSAAGLPAASGDGTINGRERTVADKRSPG
jgi:hypothetical protein